MVLDVCNVMPKSVSKECDDFVDQYADAIIQLLIGALQPNEICAVLNLCTAKTQLVQSKSAFISMTQTSKFFSIFILQLRFWNVPCAEYS